MDQIHIDIAGARQVGLRFDAFPDQLRADMLTEIDALAHELFALVQAKTPQLTGTLLAEEGTTVFDDKDKISGKVYVLAPDGNAAKKAAALEYGSAGKPVSVSAHAMSLDHYWSLRLNAPEMVAVAAYDRTPDVPEFAFERGPLAEMAPVIAERLNAVVINATKAADQ